MDIVKTKGHETPIYALTESKWDQVICKGLIPRILTMLSVDLSKNQNRIAATELMIRESANRITPKEIEEAFLMYVKGQLSGLEPIDNYLSPILFSKVITAYKQQRKPEIKPMEAPQISESEIKENALANIMLAYDHFKEHGEVPTDYSVAFDRLYEWGILPDKDSSEAVKNAYNTKLCRAHLDLVGPILDKIQWAEKEDLKDTPKYRENRKLYHELNNYNHPEVQARFRCLVLAGFFKKTDREDLRSMVVKSLETI